MSNKNGLQLIFFILALIIGYDEKYIKLNLTMNRESPKHLKKLQNVMLKLTVTQRRSLNHIILSGKVFAKLFYIFII